jgi:hypothetical protein
MIPNKFLGFLNFNFLAPLLATPSEYDPLKSLPVVPAPFGIKVD